jgi:hypothetical protein
MENPRIWFVMGSLRQKLNCFASKSFSVFPQSQEFGKAYKL